MERVANLAKPVPTREKKVRQNVVPGHIGSYSPGSWAEGAVLVRKASCACGGGCSSCQAKSGGLKVSHPNDAAEIEADQIADKVMRMPEGRTSPVGTVSRVSSGLHRKCRRCEEEEPVLRKAEARADGPVDRGIASYVHSVLRSGGQALDSRTRSFFEPRFGYDLSAVRIHTGETAAQSAHDLSALAYTFNNNIVFGQGRYQPGTQAGKRLLAHELAHVLQRGSGSFIRRQCLTGAACTQPIAGAPGQFVAAEETRQAPAQAQRTQQAERAREAQRPRAAEEPPPTAEETQAVQQIQADRHGQRAANLERLATDNGITFPASLVAGIFIDRDISPNYGAVRRNCTSFTSFVTPPTSDPNVSCIFVPVSLEDQAIQFYSDSAAAQIGQFQRNIWQATTLSTLRHERQHVVFNAAAHAYAGAGCDRNTVLYSSGTDSRSVNRYLGELSAILSEFLAYYNVITNTGDIAVRTYVFQSWLRYKVETSGETIKGIITAMRCRCGCTEVDAYVRETFLFTTSGWPSVARVVLNSLLSRYPNLNWPLRGGEPACLDDCSTRFDECTRTSRTGGMICLAQRSTCINSCDVSIQTGP